MDGGRETGRGMERELGEGGRRTSGRGKGRKEGREEERKGAVPYLVRGERIDFDDTGCAGVQNHPSLSALTSEALRGPAHDPGMPVQVSIT